MERSRNILRKGQRSWPQAFSIFLTLCQGAEPFPKQDLVFTGLQYKYFENTVRKGEIAHNEQFLLFPQSFLPIWRTFCHFHRIQIIVCKLFQSGRV